MKTFRSQTPLALTLLTVLLTGCSHHESGVTESPPPAKVEKETISFPTNAPQLAFLTVEPVQERKTFASGLSGRLAWDDDVTARVFPSVSGRIAEIVANPGDRVAAGDVLARIKSPDFGQAQADARKAVADLNVAERSLARTRELLEHGAAAQKDLEAAEAEHVRAVSENQRATATLAVYGGDAAGNVTGISSLKAPVGGVVVDKLINPGQEVRSDQVGDKPLFVISDPKKLWLYLDVTENDVASISSNQEVVVRARALPEKLFHGHVETIGAGLDAATRTIKTRCIVDNADALLRAEMYVNADINVAASGVEVPTKAVFSKDKDHFVFVEISPGQFERRSVKLGLENDGRTVIREGLSAGERVVVEGCLMLAAMLDGESS
jgi:cobalt-zinc-cadmium efflux system membrane fusion protein